MAAFARGRAIIDGSITVLRREPRLLALPIVSALAVIALLGAFTLLAVRARGLPALDVQVESPLFYVALFFLPRVRVRRGLLQCRAPLLREADLRRRASDDRRGACRGGRAMAADPGLEPLRVDLQGAADRSYTGEPANRQGRHRAGHLVAWRAPGGAAQGRPEPVRLFRAAGDRDRRTRLVRRGEARDGPDQRSLGRGWRRRGGSALDCHS